jgi:hypothetical protein
LMPFEFGVYKPSWVEISVSLAALAGFVLLFLIFSKIFPIVSVWEVSEEHHVKPNLDDVPAENTPKISESSERRDR